MNTERVLESLSEEDMAISTRRFLRAAMSAWGGPEGLAKELKLDFDAIPTGHSNRIRISELILTLMGKAGDDAMDNLVDPEMIEARLQSILRQQTPLENDDDPS